MLKTPLFVLLFFVFIFSTKAQEIGITNNSIDLSKSYRQAKIEFSNFEKLHGNFIQTKNVRMHYLTWGKPSGVPLIWSHGSLLNAYELYNVAPKLVKAGYYIIAIDYYGHGLTRFPDHEVSIYHVADDIAFLINKLKIRKAIIGGFSRGGFISSAFYDAYPNRVLGLILADGGSVSSNTHYHQMDTIALKNQFKYLDQKTHFP